MNKMMKQIFVYVGFQRPVELQKGAGLQAVR